MKKRCPSIPVVLLTIVSVIGLTAATADQTDLRRFDAFQREILLKHAIPVDANANPRRLNQDQENFQLSAAHSLQFHKCASVSSQPETDDILFDKNLIPYTSDGKIAAQKSFVLFNVCETAYCDLYAGDENLYMIDVATYMMAITVNYQSWTQNYCAACDTSQNYCAWVEYQKQNGKGENWNEYQQAEEEAQAAEEGVEGEQQEQQQAAGGGGRRRARRLANYAAFEVVECETCESMGCWNEVEDMGDIAAWVQGISQCPQTSYDFMDDGNNAYPLYSGFMCNQDGTGVEIALFLEGTCSIYDAVHSYYDMLSADNSQTDASYLAKATEMIMFPFLHEINCNGKLQYLSLQEWYRNYENNNNNANNNNNNAQLSDYCKSLFEGKDNAAAISMKDCDQDGAKDEQVEGEDQVEEYADYADNGDNKYMYKYILSYEDSMDSLATCKVVRALNGEYEMIYRWDSSGQLFDYGTHSTTNNGKKKSIGAFRKWLSQYDAMDVTLVLAVIVGIVISLLALACVLHSCFSPSGRLVRHKRQLDEHRERLVDPATGELA